MSGVSEDLVILDRGNGTTCTVHLHGATIISWKTNSHEHLFVSKNAVFDNQSHIMGGIPIVFPKFASWSDKPFHGFARVTRWVVEQKPEKTDDGDVTATFTLVDTETTRSYWNHKFSLSYILKLKETQLVCKLIVKNLNSEQSFNFDVLLHTFLQFPDITKCEITGFTGCKFVDKTQHFKEAIEGRHMINIKGHIDNIYRNTSDEHIISVVGKEKLALQKSNLPDTVVWNPWVDTVKNFPDLDEHEYKTFACVEAGQVSSPVTLNAGEQFEAVQILKSL